VFIALVGLLALVAGLVKHPTGPRDAHGAPPVQESTYERVLAGPLSKSLER
jgi:hypothetical protein